MLKVSALAAIGLACVLIAQQCTKKPTPVVRARRATRARARQAHRRYPGMQWEEGDLSGKPFVTGA